MIPNKPKQFNVRLKINGFVLEDYIVKPQINPYQFQILYSGRLYTHQRLDIFLEGVQLFISKVKPNNFKIKFYGSDRSGLANRLSGYLFEPFAYISHSL